MKLIPISKGKYYAQVDDEDFDMLSKNRWSLHKAPKNTYCIRQVMKESGKRETILMHRVIMGCKSGDGKMIDHKDHNGLNNQKSNLRFCSYAQNSMNRTPRGKSKYLGVWFSTSNKKYFVKSINDFRHTKGYSWAAQIVVNKKRICLGWFKNEEDAARAYDEAAKKHHGEFANLNFK